MELKRIFLQGGEHPDIKSDSQVLTHGYIHGHVHQHEDHMHIHGHIHNHDHESKAVNIKEEDNEGPKNCSELSIPCDDIFCGELDDCYFGNCESTRFCDEVRCFLDSCVPGRCSSDEVCVNHEQPFAKSEIETEKFTEIECCEDPACLRNAEMICDNPECLRDQELFDHTNNLCDTQQQRMDIFKNLLENVQKSVDLQRGKLESEELMESRKRRRKEQLVDNDIQIHFPHRCHLSVDSRHSETHLQVSSNDSPLIPTTGVSHPDMNMGSTSHNTHQSCFHARLPLEKRKITQPLTGNGCESSDFDFFLQFNNFTLLFEDDNAKIEPQRDYNNCLIAPQSPNAPSSYSCKWENCCKRVDDRTLLDHLIDDHISDEYRLDNRDVRETQAFQCEWFNCGFTNQDYQSFLSHLNTHKSLNEEKRITAVPGAMANSPLLTPTSIMSTFGSPSSTQVKDESNSLHGVNITQMEIKPKKTLCCRPVDDLYTCKWKIGTDENDEPIICGKVHASDGDLQAHLQIDHIGLGRSQYECCWVGCERNGGKPFNQRQKLYRHIHIHTNYKPCKCDICGASFAVAATLKQHMRIHSGEKPFACKHCEKKFTTSSALAIHTRVHSGEKPLKCLYPGCGKSFSESSNLAKHKRVHQKRFQCEDCGLVFDRKKLYTYHRREHLQRSDHLVQSNI